MWAAICFKSRSNLIKKTLRERRERERKRIKDKNNLQFQMYMWVITREDKDSCDTSAAVSKVSRQNCCSQ